MATLNLRTVRLEKLVKNFAVGELLSTAIATSTASLSKAQ